MKLTPTVLVVRGAPGRSKSTFSLERQTPTVQDSHGESPAKLEFTVQNYKAHGEAIDPE